MAAARASGGGESPAAGLRRASTPGDLERRALVGARRRSSGTRRDLRRVHRALREGVSLGVTSPPLKVGLLPKSTRNPYFQDCRSGAEEAARHLGLTLCGEGERAFSSEQESPL